MHITVSGKQVDVGDALKTHVENGLTAITSKYFDHALEARIVFGRARSFFTCDIDVHAGRGLKMRGEGEAATAHAAFDDAAEHIAKRLRRYRRRVNEHARDIANRDRPEAARQYILRQEEEGDRGSADMEPAHINGVATAELPTTQATVVAELVAEISTLSVGEAVMHMDLGDVPVLMFRNRSSGELNVVYRRSDGHIGWIDTAAAASR